MHDHQVHSASQPPAGAEIASTHSSPASRIDALALYNCVTTRFLHTEQTVAPRCECREPLIHEDERASGVCFRCQAKGTNCSTGAISLPSTPFLLMKGQSV